MSNLTWKDSNPTSKEFDDIYFSTEDGLAETGYVFIDGNNLKKRWENNNSDFTIIETGFGTGLNFFSAYDLWLKLNINATLNFISIERYPLESEDIKKAISVYGEFSETLDKFLAHYPSANINLNKCKLTILFEDILTALPKIVTKADAWFLDGFAPAKNPQMWCDQLYNTMSVKTSKKGTFSTFTSAGIVRRSLIENGFDVKKIKGYGKKREMLKGVLIS